MNLPWQSQEMSDSRKVKVPALLHEESTVLAAGDASPEESAEPSSIMAEYNNQSFNRDIQVVSVSSAASKSKFMSFNTPTPNVTRFVPKKSTAKKVEEKAQDLGDDDDLDFGDIPLKLSESLEPASVMSENAVDFDNFDEDFEIHDSENVAPSKLQLKSNLLPKPSPALSSASKQHRPVQIIDNSMYGNVSAMLSEARDVLEDFNYPNNNILSIKKDIDETLKRTQEGYLKRHKLFKDVEEITNQAAAAQEELLRVKKEFNAKQAEEDALIQEVEMLKLEIENLKLELSQNESRSVVHAPKQYGKLFHFIPLKYQTLFILGALLLMQILAVFIIFAKYRSYINSLETALLYNTEPFDFFVDEVISGQRNPGQSSSWFKAFTDLMFGDADSVSDIIL